MSGIINTLRYCFICTRLVKNKTQINAKQQHTHRAQNSQNPWCEATVLISCEGSLTLLSTDSKKHEPIFWLFNIWIHAHMCFSRKAHSILRWKRKNPFPASLRNMVTSWTSKQQWTWMNMFINTNMCINMTGMWNNVYPKAHCWAAYATQFYYIHLKDERSEGFCEDLCAYAQSHTKSKNATNRNYHHGVEEAHGGSYVHWPVQMGVRTLASIMWCWGSSAGSLYLLVSTDGESVQWHGLEFHWPIEIVCIF